MTRAIEIAAAVRSGGLSPVIAVRDALDRIGMWQPTTNAFSQIWAEEAVGSAREAERATGEDGVLGFLHGVPIAVKDLFDVAGHETTGCSAVYAGNFAERDSELVRRLTAAGAIIVGKTNQHELAMGATNVISACGPTRNPWDPARITGGSSGGSAAAVASGAVSVALGTDTGGSIRIPASLCGCFGLKPTHGVLSLEGVMPLAPSLDCPGPMAATAADLDLLWRALSGSREVARPHPPARVGTLGGHFARRVHHDVRGAVEATEAVLRSLGSDVVAIDGDGVEDSLEIWVDLVCDEMVAAHPFAAERRELLHPRIAGFIARGMNLTEEERVRARVRTREIALWFEERIAGFDVLLSPTTPYSAPSAEQDTVDVGEGNSVDVHQGGTSIFTRPVSLSGLPAIAVPAGRDARGLPLSVQLIGQPDSEAGLIASAMALETADERFRTRFPSR